MAFDQNRRPLDWKASDMLPFYWSAMGIIFLAGP